METAPTLRLYFHHFPDDPELHICGSWDDKPANAHFKMPDIPAIDGTPSREEAELAGNAIFKALFPAPLRALLDKARQKHRNELRIRLSIPAQIEMRDQLERVPWEYALDPDTDEFLGLSRRLIFIRDLGEPEPLAKLAGSPPVRILVAWASPEDCSFVDVKGELSAIRAAWGDRAHVFELPNASFSQFCDRVRQLSEQDRLHVVHFIGHGGQAGNQQPVLAFELNRKRELVTASDFATQLEGRPDLRLVVLSACKTATPPEGWEHDPSRSFAYALLRRGIPAVVATRSNVADPAAVSFSEVFHSSLSGGAEVEVAAAEARRRLAQARRNLAMDGLLQWAVPLLYCQASSGLLFDFAEPSRIDPMRLAITTVKAVFRPTRQIHELSLSEAFAGRKLKEDQSWDGIRDLVYQFVREHFWVRQRVELRLDAFLSVSFATGFCVGTRGCPVTLLQTDRRTGQELEWSLSADPQPRPNETTFTFGPLQGASEHHLAVAVSISQPSILAEVVETWPQLALGPAAFLQASIPADHNAILDADHAWKLASSLAARMKEECHNRKIHLFMAGPPEFAFFLGQLCGFLGEIQLYEFDREATPKYSPSILVRPSDRLLKS